MKTIKPFENESETIAIDELTIENRLDRVAMYGSLDITKDKAGLEKARQLKSLIDGIVETLAAADLPDAITLDKSDTVINPFPS